MCGKCCSTCASSSARSVCTGSTACSPSPSGTRGGAVSSRHGDRLGIKPFFYHHNGNRLLFASEVKALLEGDPSLRRPDKEALAATYHMDFALPALGAYGYFAVSRLARRHVKVSLTGHGGDEIFAGYPKHFGVTFGSTAMFDLSGRPFEGPSPLQRMRKVLRREGPTGVVRRLGLRLRRSDSSFEDRWVSYCGNEPAHNPMLHPRFIQALGDYSPRDCYVQAFRDATTDEILDKCLYHDLRVYLPQLLAMEDRLSIAVSLESRVPLLDHRVVELLGRVPPALKVSGRQPKRLLKEIVRRLLPEHIVERRDKRPFPVPVGRWLAGDLAASVRDILRSPASLDRDIFDPDRLRDDTMPAALTWAILNVELWFRIFVDRDPSLVEQAMSLTVPRRVPQNVGAPVHS